MHDFYGIEISKEAFPIYFIIMWLLVTTILSFFSGWYKLMQIYPDFQNKESGALSIYKNQSGSMGAWVSMRGILTFEVFKSGLRLKMFRLFGPFDKNIFIPWSQIKVERKKRFFGDTVILSFGNGGLFSRLEIEAQVANRLWHDAGVTWPGESFVPERPTKEVVRSLIIKQWMIITSMAATFFIVAPRFIEWQKSGQLKDVDFPSIPEAILFPGIVFGVASIFRYYKSTK